MSASRGNDAADAFSEALDPDGRSINQNDAASWAELTFHALPSKLNDHLPTFQLGEQTFAAHPYW